MIPSVVLSVFTAFVLTVSFGVGTVLRFIPFLLIVPIAAYVLTAERKEDPKRILNEAPTAIGMMAVRILMNGSMDTAVRDVASHGPKRISRSFRKAVKATDLRIHPDIGEAVMDAVGNIDVPSFTRSVRMLISASETSDDNERRRIVHDAESISINGLREMGERYGSSLNGPCMMVFGIGIMIPMVMMSLLPMLNVGGIFSVSFLNTGTVAFITLVLIPGIVAVIIASVASGNPFSERFGNVPKEIFLFIMAPIIMMTVYNLTGNIGSSLIISLTATSVLIFLVIRPKILDDRKRKKIREVMEGSMFDIGNRMSSGDDFCHVLISSLDSRKDTAEVSNRMRNALMVCRGDVEFVISSFIPQYSDAVADSYIQIYRASLKDIRDAGRLAVNIGNQLQDRSSVKTGIDNKLRSMTEMMSGTAMLFAPLIMALSVVLMRPLSEMSDTLVTGDVTVILIIYLTELALLVSVLTSYLGNDGNTVNIAYRFSYMLPVSLIIFMAVMGIRI